MSQGDWIGYQTGGLQGEDFLRELKPLEEGHLRVPFFLVHGRHDNWMTVARALEILESAEGPKEHLIIEEEPVFSAQQVVTHTMPVAEQLHWVRHRAADWIADQFAEITARRKESR
jgi:pimeloyl-ACP methyl ester carboxylesterase